MKNLRQMCAAIVLTMVLAVSALAGQIQCPGAPDPGETHTPPSGSQAPGEIPMTDSAPVTALLTILDLLI